MLKDFTGYRVCSNSICCISINGKIVDKTVRKAFPNDDESTLYIVKLKGVRSYYQLYEDEMIK
jgi:hypothetical protein